MEEQQKTAKDQELKEDHEENEAIELVLFQVSECYVYLIPPRKSAASYRADEWDVNKWAWEGKLKVLSKGEECIIRLEDKSTGELYARAFLRDGEQHPVEPVIDSSRYFVLRIEENIDGRLRHAFIGIGFRERTEAYDFQAALHDHMKYLNKKKSAEEMEQQFQKTSLTDYSLKDGETIVLQLKSNKSTSNIKKSSELDVKVSSSEEEGNTKKESIFCIKPPPPPPAPLSPVAAPKSPTNLPPNINLEEPSKHKNSEPAKEDSNAAEGQSTLDVPDDDFGDFQTAG